MRTPSVAATTLGRFAWSRYKKEITCVTQIMPKQCVSVTLCLANAKALLIAGAESGVSVTAACRVCKTDLEGVTHSTRCEKG